MAPFAYSSGFPLGQHNGSVSTIQAPPSRLHDVEIIEIDDDDDDDDEEEDEDEDDNLEDDLDDDDEDDDDDDDDDEEEDQKEDDNEEEDEENEEEDDMTGTDSMEERSSDFEETEQGNAITISSGLASPSLLATSNIQQVINPLRNTADRVASQIEAFAQNLNQFKQHTRARPGDPEAFREACKLVQKYQKIAETSAKELSTTSTFRKAKQSAINRGSGASQGSNGRLDEQIRRWQLEAETWELLLQMLSIDDPESRARAQRAQQTVFQSLHRYSSDQEVWNKFLEADHFALENFVVLKWLEKTARSSPQDIDGLISELETQAERGQGLWAHGWLYTKEAIKGAKRLRSWPQPLEPEDPGLTISLMSVEKQEPLVTQLDPDAVTRQRHGLQKQDQFYEQAAWLTCWKMLRQGQSWEKIQEWSHERLENWRAISVCGTPTDYENNAADPGLTRLISCRSQESWRRSCLALANNPQTSNFEKAVYALICGETEPAYPICQGWGDYVYVFINHSILARYREFCKQFHRKLSFSPATDMALSVEPPGYDSVHAFLDNVKRNEKTAVEARNPYRTIQTAILSKNYNTFFFHQANAVSKAASLSNKATLVPKTVIANADDACLIAARDEDAIRIISHLFLILQSLGYVRSDSRFVETASVNVIGYINLLRKAGKLELIPLYASLLPEDTAHMVLGNVLIDIVEPEDRERQVTIMKRLNINLSAIVECQWRLVISQADAKEDKTTTIRLKRSVIHQPKGLSRIGPIKKNLIGRRISHEDEYLIRCLEWHRYADDQLPNICPRGTHLYKRFMGAGRLAAARELFNRVRVNMVPADITGLGHSPFEILANGSENGFDELPSPVKASPTKSPRKSGIQRRRPLSSNIRAELYLQSHTMRDLEYLIAAFDSLETWAGQMDQYEHLSDKQQAKEFRKTLQVTIDTITERIEPLCGEWLSYPKDDAEATELEFIKSTYLPEVILAYHSALFFAGHTIGREVLTQCMMLSSVIASSPSLTNSFIASGRMCELVDALALSSIAMMSAKDSKLKKKLEDGASLDIWKIKPQQDVELV
ncbi:nuclear pore complex protein Nup107 [Histoplasma capsulatum G186AR]|uniref:Nuclear pore complex protein n=1 Tax=Ajellomyces capsulatus TaxID=5037 RepID=A0A8H8D2N7_AJECA|nr:nuclear pore complex protein Nup107 [Histoplasma capsulatum]QSS67989.1 nuclear pore complex protein Nup107 [Histoplasma capsulatum G186AR]